jgi:hypothetical protein
MNTRILPPLVAVLCAVSSALAATNLTSTLADQTKVAVTVYNNGFGVVRDERRLTLPVGDVELRFMEVASAIQPETVQIDPLTAGGQLAVREQNYEYDLLSPAKLLEKYVGKTLTLIQRNDYKNARIPVAATLLSFNDGRARKSTWPRCRRISWRNRRWSGCWPIASPARRRWWPTI